MEMFYAFCAGIFTASIVVAVIYLVRTLEQVRKTAEQAQKTAASLDILARNINDSAEAVGTVSQNIAHLSESVKSGWIHAAQMAVGFITGLRQPKKHRGSSNGEESESESDRPAHEASEEP